MARKKTSLGCLFWLALVLLVVVVFLFNQKNIETVLENTGFLDLFERNDGPPEITINGEPPPASESRDQPEAQNGSGGDQGPEGSGEADPGRSDATGEPTTQDAGGREAVGSEEVVIEVKTTAESGGADATDGEDAASAPSERTKTRKARIYFVSVDPDGRIGLRAVFRIVEFRDSPLKQTLITLMRGPKASELNQGLLNIIPEGAALRGVTVRGGTAFIDFSENFRFNPIGQAGLKAQLQQIVYTATEFSTVHNVQILIDGEIQEYLNSEGLYIREPLSRSSF